MPTPKRKLSRSRIGMRSANKGITPKPVTVCSNSACSTPTLPHEVCMQCGFYRGTKVMTTKADRDLKRTEIRATKAAKETTSQNSEQ
jgi:large subunit ribosomal protein L32